MMRLRAITSMMGVWATAVSTLLAGSPRLDCRCPDGRVKPFCLSILFQSACCDGSCCSEATRDGNGQATTKPSCCCRASQQSGEQPFLPPRSGPFDGVQEDLRGSESLYRF
jgi:hypothetical protein